MAQDDDRARSEFTGEAEELLEELSRDIAAFESQGTSARPKNYSNRSRAISRISRARAAASGLS